ncbi:MAG TPA: CDP-alcohol phosphatidyltransferase family protein [Cytophagaceae bacterium]|nr:CDP-alcohol phosphatidyltransferase family protein [Cytophagaceae bacterium]
MNIKKHIPNFLTCCNLLCGIAGIYYAWLFNHDLTYASFFIYLACLFDFSDGFAARALKVSSPIGKELDSLADMVTFGVLPGFMMALMLGLPTLNYMANVPEETIYFMRAMNSQDSFWLETASKLAPFAFLITVCSALRLAKFNIDTRQSDQFIGVPTPANALFISALPFLAKGQTEIGSIFTHPLALLIMVPVLSYLLVAELPLIALKFKNYGWEDNKMRYILIISALLLVLTLKFVAIPIIIILYIILSIIENKLSRGKKPID